MQKALLTTKGRDEEQGSPLSSRHSSTSSIASQARLHYTPDTFNEVVKPALLIGLVLAAGAAVIAATCFEGLWRLYGALISAVAAFVVGSIGSYCCCVRPNR